MTERAYQEQDPEDTGVREAENLSVWEQQRKGFPGGSTWETTALSEIDYLQALDVPAVDQSATVVEVEKNITPEISQQSDLGTRHQGELIPRSTKVTGATVAAIAALGVGYLESRVAGPTLNQLIDIVGFTAGTVAAAVGLTRAVLYTADTVRANHGRVKNLRQARKASTSK